MRAGSPALTQVHIRTLVIYHIIYKNASVFLECETMLCVTFTKNSLYGATHHHSARIISEPKQLSRNIYFVIIHPKKNGPPPYPQADRDDRNCTKFTPCEAQFRISNSAFRIKNALALARAFFLNPTQRRV